LANVYKTIINIMQRVATMTDEGKIQNLPAYTTSFLTHSTIQNIIVEFVTRRIQSTVRSMVNQGSQSLILDTASMRPYENQINNSTIIKMNTQICDIWTLRKCLLLAVYNCHRYSAKTDKLLRDKRKGRDTSSALDEEQTERITSRSRIFSLRRLMASYEDITRRVVEKSTSPHDDNHYTRQHCTNENLLRNLLSDQVDESLIYFCDVAILHDVQKLTGNQLVQSGYWCSMREESARSIADMLQLDFEFYLE
jgi:hypothetical protein